MMATKMMSPRKRMDMEGSGVTVKMAKGGSSCGTKRMMGGGMVPEYQKGGKVRGYGKARGGRPCKMV